MTACTSAECTCTSPHHKLHFFVTCTDTGHQSHGRQLPAPPSFDVEDSLEPPISTMADELATTGGLPTTNARGEFVHPDGQSLKSHNVLLHSRYMYVVHANVDLGWVKLKFHKP